MVDPGQLPALDGKVTPGCRTGRDDDCVIASPQVGDRDVHSHLYVRPKLNSLGFHLRESLIHVVLFHFELGDSVTQQAPDPVRPLVHRHRVASARQLLRSRESGGSGSDHRDRVAGQ